MDLTKLLYFIHLVVDVVAHVSIGIVYGSYFDHKYRKNLGSNIDNTKADIQTKKDVYSRLKIFIKKNYYALESVIISTLPDVDSVLKIGAEYFGGHRTIIHSLPTAIATGLYTKWKHNDFKRGFLLLVLHLLVDLASGGSIRPFGIGPEIQIWPSPEYIPNPILGFIFDLALHSSVIVVSLFLRYKYWHRKS